MLRTLLSTLSAALAFSAPLVAAQDITSNATSLTGTWSSGSGAVVTGPSFADPMNNDRPFIYPSNTGISYSFTDDGYFEMAQYRFNANASRPDCPTAVVLWQHGTYALHPNNSLTMDPSPFAMDGRVQTQNPCSPTTNVLTEFAQFEVWNSWKIGIDTNHAAYALQAVDVNGKKPRMFLTVRPPTMLPTASLTGIFNGSIPLSP